MIWHHHVAWGQYRAGPRAHSSEQRPMTDYCGLTTADGTFKLDVDVYPCLPTAVALRVSSQIRAGF